MRHLNGLDPYPYALGRIRALTPEFKWTREVDQHWVERLRNRLKGSVGLPDELRVPLDLEVLDEVDCGEFDRQTITFTTRPGLRCFGYLLVPKHVTEPLPANVCVPGHGEGVDALVGVGKCDYQNQFALQSVRAGFITLAIEPVSFGHRMAPIGPDRGSSCLRDSMAALMLGETMIGWRCWDAIVAVDLLQSMPSVDPHRIAITGISGGGLVAFWAACFDQRIQAALVSGYFNTFLDSILSIDHCVDNFAPGLAKVVEMPDMVSLIAPRKLFVESGRDDSIFPIAAFRSACQIAESIYAKSGFSENFDSHEFEGEHIFNGSRGLPKLKAWFSN